MRRKVSLFREKRTRRARREELAESSEEKAKVLQSEKKK